MPALVVVNDGTLPVPLVEPKPMASAVRDHVKIAPGVLLVKTTDGTVAPTQYVWFATGSTDGFGFTVKVLVDEGLQAGSVGVGVKMA